MTITEEHKSRVETADPSEIDPQSVASTQEFLVTSKAWETAGQMPVEEFPGTLAFIGDVYANPGGSALAAGYFRLEHTDAPLDYLYEYDEMKVVLSGEFRLENLDTGKVTLAGEKDAIFFPKGSHIRFSTPTGALAYYVGLRSFEP